MKKISTFGLLALIVFVFSPVVLAKSNTAGVGTGTPSKTMVSPTSGAGVANQNQVKTQNAGEESQLMINTAEKEELEGSTLSAAIRNEMAIQKMSDVAKGVEEILNTKTLKGGIGDQVKLIAQEQKQSQDQIRLQIDKMSNRGALVKYLIGPNYVAIKNLENQIFQNMVRIEQLTELKNQLANAGDINMVQETINALIEQNTSLQDRVSVENNQRSLLGWLIKFFIK